MKMKSLANKKDRIYKSTEISNNLFKPIISDKS